MKMGVNGIALKRGEGERDIWMSGGRGRIKIVLGEMLSRDLYVRLVRGWKRDIFKNLRVQGARQELHSDFVAFCCSSLRK